MGGYDDQVEVKHNGMSGLCFPGQLHLTSVLWGPCVGTLCGDTGTALHHLLMSARGLCCENHPQGNAQESAMTWQLHLNGGSPAFPHPPHSAAQHKQKEVPTVPTN